MNSTPEIRSVTSTQATIVLPAGDFNLYREGDGSGWDLLAENVSGKYVDVDVKSGQDYRYSVREIDNGKEGHRSDVAEVTIPDVSVEAVTDWDPDINAANTTISLPTAGVYNIYRDGELVGTSDGSDAFVDDDLQGDMDYNYQVAKINDGVEGPLSDPVEVTTPDSDQLDDLEQLGIDTSQLDENDLEAMGLADIDLNDPEERNLAMDILRNDVGKTLQEDMIDASSELKDGGSSDSWFLTVAAILAGGLTLAGLVGAGGTDNFTETARRKTEEEAADQFDYLDGFANDVASGKQSLTGVDGRLGKYGNSLTAITERVRQDEALSKYKFARRVLMPGAQHCASCLLWAEASWMPIADCPPIGEECECHDQCLCSMEFSEEDPRETDDGEPVDDAVDESPQDYAKKISDRWDFSVAGGNEDFAALFYNPEEPRDSHGQWTSGGGDSSSTKGFKDQLKEASDLTIKANEARAAAKDDGSVEALHKSADAHKKAADFYSNLSRNAESAGDMKMANLAEAKAYAHSNSEKKSRGEGDDKAIKQAIKNDKDANSVFANALKDMGAGQDALKTEVDIATKQAEEAMNAWAKDKKDGKALMNAKEALEVRDKAKEKLEAQRVKDRSDFVKAMGVDKKPAKAVMDFVEGFNPSHDQKRAINDGMAFIRGISGHDVDVSFKADRSRANKELESNVINIGEYSGVTAASAVIHEIGHQIEETNPEVFKMAKDFVAMRTRGEEETSMAKWGMKGEYGKKDNFDKAFDEASAYYIGKEYHGFNTTEVLSMGLEKLYDDPKGLMKKDPEFATLLIKALRGK